MPAARSDAHTHTNTAACAHPPLFFNSFLSLPAIMEVTVRLILHRSQDLIVSVKLTVNKRKRSEGTMCQSVQLKLPVEVAVVGGRGINICLFCSLSNPLCLFFLFSFFPKHTADRPTSLPTPSLTALPGLPTAITYKTFQGRHTWSGF